MTVRIDRCTCSDRTFADIAAVAKESGVVTFEELRDAADFGKRCRLCHPYVKRMLETGETVFTELIVAPENVGYEDSDPDSTPGR
jgi:NAD(P)H-nitrite reductase large subunit